MPPEGCSTVEVTNVDFVHSRLNWGTAQSLTGARCEHCKPLHVSLVQRLVQRLLNGVPSKGWSVLTACHSLALGKGDQKVRSIAILEAIRRIAARVVCCQEHEDISNVLSEMTQPSPSTNPNETPPSPSCVVGICIHTDQA